MSCQVKKVLTIGNGRPIIRLMDRERRSGSIKPERSDETIYAKDAVPGTQIHAQFQTGGELDGKITTIRQTSQPENPAVEVEVQDYLPGCPKCGTKGIVVVRKVSLGGGTTVKPR